MASALGRGYDELADALTLGGVPFVVLYGPDAPTGWGGSRADAIGIWILDDSKAIEGFERAWGRLKESDRLSSLLGQCSRLHVSHRERPFEILVKPALEFASALAGASYVPHEAGGAPVASPERRAEFQAEQEAGRAMLTREAAGYAAAQEHRSEVRILALIATQRAARQKAKRMETG